MLNNQKIEKRVVDRSAPIAVHSIFYTIQGEGPFSGTPAVFLRLAGCNLKCPYCDTDYTSNRVPMYPLEILREIRAKHPHENGLVVITGGEPFRQMIGDLIDTLTDAGFYIQVETNGTIAPPKLQRGWRLDPFNRRRGAYLVCSPKTGKIAVGAAANACAFKYVLDAENVDEGDGLPTKALGHPANPKLARPPDWYKGPIYIQPADHKNTTINSANLDATIDSSLKFGYILQLQVHKYLDME